MGRLFFLYSSMNLSGYYENDKYSARLSYRSEFFKSLNETDETWGEEQDQWDAPSAQGSFIKNNQRQTVLFDKPQTGRYLRFVAASGFQDIAYAAVAELEMIIEQE